VYCRFRRLLVTLRQRLPSSSWIFVNFFVCLPNWNDSASIGRVVLEKFYCYPSSRFRFCWNLRKISCFSSIFSYIYITISQFARWEAQIRYLAVYEINTWNTLEIEKMEGTHDDRNAAWLHANAIWIVLNEVRSCELASLLPGHRIS
jgi:hypothetical protein